jgi:hypothetical protein
LDLFLGNAFFIGLYKEMYENFEMAQFTFYECHKEFQYTYLPPPSFTVSLRFYGHQSFFTGRTDLLNLYIKSEQEGRRIK